MQVEKFVLKPKRAQDQTGLCLALTRLERRRWMQPNNTAHIPGFSVSAQYLVAIREAHRVAGELIRGGYGDTPTEFELGEGGEIFMAYLPRRDVPTYMLATVWTALDTILKEVQQDTR